MGLRVDISAASLLLGILVGAGTTLAGGHYLPKTMLPAPAVRISDLYYGVDETGTPTLCDGQGRAYEISDERGITRRWNYQPNSPDGHPMQALEIRCMTARHQGGS